MGAGINILPAIPVLAAGGGVRRRFIDIDGALFFEVALKPADCRTP